MTSGEDKDLRDEFIVAAIIFVILAVMLVTVTEAKKHHEREQEQIVMQEHQITRCPACHLQHPVHNDCGKLKGDTWADCMNPN